MKAIRHARRARALYHHISTHPAERRYAIKMFVGWTAIILFAVDLLFSGLGFAKLCGPDFYHFWETTCHTPASTWAGWLGAMVVAFEGGSFFGGKH